MLIARDVLRYAGDLHRHYRVVWCNQAEVVLFDLDAKGTRLTRRLRADVVAEIEEGAAELILDHAFDLLPNPSVVSDRQKARRMALLAILEPLLAQAPAIFDDRVRGSAIASLDREKVTSAKTLHQAFDRYWRRGMSLAALTPSFGNCGRGRRTPGTAKLGRPRDEGKPSGLNVTAEMKEIFDLGLRRFYANNRKNSLKAAYDVTVADFFTMEVVDPLRRSCRRSRMRWRCGGGGALDMWPELVRDGRCRQLWIGALLLGEHGSPPLHHLLLEGLLIFLARWR